MYHHSFCLGEQVSSFPCQPSSHFVRLPFLSCHYTFAAVCVRPVVNVDVISAASATFSFASLTAVAGCSAVVDATVARDRQRVGLSDPLASAFFFYSTIVIL